MGRCSFCGDENHTRNACKYLQFDLFPVKAIYANMFLMLNRESEELKLEMKKTHTTPADVEAHTTAFLNTLGRMLGEWKKEMTDNFDGAKEDEIEELEEKLAALRSKKKPEAGVVEEMVVDEDEDDEEEEEEKPEKKKAAKR